MKEGSTIEEHLLKDYWQGEATEADAKLVEAWLAESGENARLYEQWQQAWEHAGAMADFEAIDVEARWKQVKGQLPGTGKGKQVSFFPTVWRYAAGLVLLAAFTYLLWPSGEVQMREVTASAETVKVDLPDGTEVWLNENATLRYPEKFEASSRKVELTGEAFFEVTHNPDRPFSVLSDGTETRVLGTSFNLKEQEGDKLELILVTGKVRFEKGEEWEILAPGEKLTVDEAGTITKQLNNETNFMAWRTRKLVFDNTAMRDVIKDVQALYDVEIEIASALFADCPLTTTFQNDSLEVVLETFNILFDTKTEKTDQGYRIVGGGCASN